MSTLKYSLDNNSRLRSYRLVFVPLVLIYFEPDFDDKHIFFL